MAIALDYQAVTLRRKRSALLFNVQCGLGFVLLILLASKVWMKIRATEMGYKIAELRQEAVSLDMEKRELSMKHSLLVKSDALTKKAAAIGLASVNPNKLFRIVEERR